MLHGFEDIDRSHLQLRPADQPLLLGDKRTDADSNHDQREREHPCHHMLLLRTQSPTTAHTLRLCREMVNTFRQPWHRWASWGRV
ncbi:MAG: hypothetical protein SH850_08080 [Planctomycetaceae bacterium]|nr:hypothetical protein [Planctomycetaceae bacterium]